jgi:TIR domain
MTTSKLFISHSTKTDENRSILDAVCEKLEKTPGIGLLVDKNIKPDNEWFPELYEYMWGCHGAVIFLSKAALQSEWVKAEAAVLCARKRRHADFKLLLVALDKVDPKHLDNQPFFKTIRLGDFQTLAHDGSGDSIYSALTASLKDLTRPETPFEEMVRQIGTILKPIAENNQVDLEKAIIKLEPSFGITQDNLAESLTRLLLRYPDKIFNNARSLFIALSNLLTQRQALNMLEIVKGYWVHPEAAALLSKTRNDQGAVAINGVEISNFTGQCYARQAWPTPQPFKVVSLNGFERDINKIEEALLSEVPGKTVPERLRKKTLHDYPDPLLLVFPYPNSNDNDAQASYFPEETLLNDIMAKLKNVTVMLATGPEIPSYLDYVTPLEPLLQPDKEDEKLIEHSFVQSYIQENLKG